MPLLRDWQLEITVDQVLGGQGADPEATRRRRPSLVQVAESALDKAAVLLEPIVLYRHLKVESFQHERLRLTEGGVLSGQLVAERLGMAERVVVMVCTIGRALEERVSGLFAVDPPYALALDGLGSAAVTALATEACRFFETQAAAEGLQATLPISPGAPGWPVDEGQLQIFDLLDASRAGVKVLPSGMMIPRKSASMVIGLGPDVADASGRLCDYCDLRETCRYQHRYTPPS